MSKRGEGGGKMRTNERTTKHEIKDDTLEDYDYRKDIVTTTLYCVCKDCIKYCNYRKPVMCIDPFLMDMRHTYWIYHGLVMASRTERAIVITTPAKTHKKKGENKENAKGK